MWDRGEAWFGAHRGAALIATDFWQEHNVPSNFSTLKDNLLRRLRQLQSTNSEWDRQIRSLEIRLESQTSYVAVNLPLNND